jgi:hypothetical protein
MPRYREQGGQSKRAPRPPGAFDIGVGRCTRRKLTELDTSIDTVPLVRRHLAGVSYNGG